MKRVLGRIWPHVVICMLILLTVRTVSASQESAQIPPINRIMANIIQCDYGMNFADLQTPQTVSYERAAVTDAQLTNYVQACMRTLYIAGQVTIENGRAYVPETTIQSMIRSLFGWEMTSPVSSEHMTYEAGRYSMPCADGEPMPVLRLSGRTVNGDTAVLTAEILRCGNDGNYSRGMIYLTVVQDPASAYGYHVVSSERKALDSEIVFTDTQGSSVLPASSYGDYWARNTKDRNLSTAWVEGVEGYGEGQSVTWTADTPQKVHGLWIFSGYGKSNDIFQKNSRPVRYRIEFSDGTVLEPADDGWEIPDGNDPVVMGPLNEVTSIPDGLTMESAFDYYIDSISFGREIETTFIRITILEVMPGWKYADTCISEIQPY